MIWHRYRRVDFWIYEPDPYTDWPGHAVYDYDDVDIMREMYESDDTGEDWEDYKERLCIEAFRDYKSGVR